MLFKTIAALLLFAFPIYSQGWKRIDRRVPYQYYPYSTGISGGTAVAVGIGSGVVGYILGRRAAANQTTPVYVQHTPHIECREFDIRVVIDNQNKIAKITKCRVDGGEWKIPD